MQTRSTSLERNKDWRETEAEKDVGTGTGIDGGVGTGKQTAVIAGMMKSNLVTTEARGTEDIVEDTGWVMMNIDMDVASDGTERACAGRTTKAALDEDGAVVEAAVEAVVEAVAGATSNLVFIEV